MKDQERGRHVGTARAMDDEPAERDEPSGEREIVAPLTRRDPRPWERDQREDDAEISGIENVLAPHPQHELGADGDERGERVRRAIVGTQQQREAERGDQRAQQARAATSDEKIAGARRGYGRSERESALLRSDREIAQQGGGTAQRAQ